MPTIHQQSLAAVAGALDSLATVPADQVHTERQAPLDASDCPAINVLPDGIRFEPFGSEGPDGIGLLRADVGVLVRIHTRGDPHSATADPIITELNAALMADPSLGGLAQRLLLTDSRPQADRADTGTAGIWELTYRLVAIVDERTLAVLSS